MEESTVPSAFKNSEEVPPVLTNDVEVTTPHEFTSPTVISGVPERPKEVVAKLAVDAEPTVPIRVPSKLVAVTTPLTVNPVTFLIEELPASSESPDCNSWIWFASGL